MIMAKTEMRPIKDTIPLEEARTLIEQASAPVSYTHLTLPTICSV